MNNIHASCIAIKRKGVLFIGASGAGKSDMALRLIEFCGAKLVADDRVDISVVKGQIKASCPNGIKGLLEVRGVGIVSYPYVLKTTVKMIVELTNKPLERLPVAKFYNLNGIQLPLIRLNPFESSSCAKVLSALRLL